MNRLNVLLILNLLLFLCVGGSLSCSAKECLSYHQHLEQSYQKAWQKKYGGILEYKNEDNTRVDCLTKSNAIEFDFANKWAEAVGQALYYQYKTGKRGKVVLILEHPKTQMIYFKRIKILSNIYNFDVEYITPEILNLNQYNQCSNPNCKCKKRI